MIDKEMAEVGYTSQGAGGEKMIMWAYPLSLKR